MGGHPIGGQIGYGSLATRRGACVDLAETANDPKINPSPSTQISLFFIGVAPQKRDFARSKGTPMSLPNAPDLGAIAYTPARQAAQQPFAFVLETGIAGGRVDSRFPAQYRYPRITGVQTPVLL
jgi:hypothetical protein